MHLTIRNWHLETYQREWELGQLSHVIDTFPCWEGEGGHSIRKKSLNKVLAPKCGSGDSEQHKFLAPTDHTICPHHK